MTEVRDPGLGVRVRHYRRRAGLTQEELAERAGLSVRALAYLERGERHPHPGTLARLADALGLSSAEREALLDAAEGATEGYSNGAHSDGGSRFGMPSSLRVSLPVQPTAFIGREREVAAINDLLGRDEVRLLNLTGPGGIGKTRLAIEAASGLTDDFPDGVVFVGLGSLSDPSLVGSTISSALAVKEVVGQPIEETLATYLGTKHLLVVLDNFEHLMPAVPLMSNLLRSCPQLVLLVTSRAMLHLSFEHDFPVSPLLLPDLVHLPDLDRLSRYDAMQLFLRRARAVRPDFSLTEKNAPIVAEICSRLDGLPLAIELAAARVRHAPPRELLGKITHRLQVLTGGPIDVPAKHRTMRAAIEWSYYLLSAEQQMLFARLSVFAGGCTLEAAETVCNPEGELDVVEGIGYLVEQSLIRQEGEEEPHFSMLETIREYASERLERCGEPERLRARHVDYHLELAETADNRWSVTQQRTWLDRLDSEQANLNAVMQWTVASGDFERAARLTVALHAYRCTRGHWTMHDMWLGTLLQQDIAPSTAAWGRLLRCAGSMAILRGEYERAAPLLHRSLELLRGREDLVGVAASLRQQAILAVYQGRFDDAVALLNEGLSLARASKDKHAVAECLDNLGGVMLYQGKLAQATSLMQESLGLYRELGHQVSIAEVLRDLAWVALQQDQFTDAVSLLKESLRTARDLHDVWILTYCFEGLARAAAALGFAERALTLWGALEALQEDEPMDFPPSERALHEEYLAAARRQLRDDEGSRAQQQGKTMSADEAVEFAIATTWNVNVSQLSTHT